MRRKPEPAELMDDPLQAEAYAEADFSGSNQLFLRYLSDIFVAPKKARALDLGCGTCDITLALATEYPSVQIDGIDGSDAMLHFAQKNIDANPSVKNNITLMQEMLPCAHLEEKAYDLIICNSLVHHLADPLDLWLTIQYCAKPGATFIVMDLARPSSEIAADSLVETYAMFESDQLREDFRNSLIAAYTREEIVEQLQKTHLKQYPVELVSDRHWLVRGHLQG